MSDGPPIPIACLGECKLELSGEGEAGYLHARLRGAAPREAALAGHRLAGAVVGAPGAIIPREAMPQEPSS